MRFVGLSALGCAAPCGNCSSMWRRPRVKAPSDRPPVQPCGIPWFSAQRVYYAGRCTTPNCRYAIFSANCSVIQSTDKILDEQIAAGRRRGSEPHPEGSAPKAGYGYVVPRRKQRKYLARNAAKFALSIELLERRKKNSEVLAQTSLPQHARRGAAAREADSAAHGPI
jgi:hypothetical protein